MKDSKFKIVLAVIVTFVVTAVLTVYVSGHFLFYPDAPMSITDEAKAYLTHYYYEDLDSDSLEWAAAKGMCTQADEYTHYYTPDEYNAYMKTASGVYVGLGVIIAPTDANEIVVVYAYEDGPGAEAGVLPGDIITHVDGIAYGGDLLDEASDAMRGADMENPENTPVTITIKREGESFDLNLVRRQVHLKTVASEMLEDGIGYIRIISFDSDTDAEFEENLKSVEALGAKKVIIDLRDNGGGDYDTACRLAGKLLNEGDIVAYSEDKYGEKKYEYAKGKISDIPVIVLANENTASASEVLLGALRANERVEEIVGKKTFGKGIIQGVIPLKNGGGMSITVARYFSADGVCIHGVGIEPTVEVDSGFGSDVPSTQYPFEDDLQLKKAIELCR